MVGRELRLGQGHKNVLSTPAPPVIGSNHRGSHADRSFRSPTGNLLTTWFNVDLIYKDRNWNSCCTFCSCFLFYGCCSKEWVSSLEEQSGVTSVRFYFYFVCTIILDFERRGRNLMASLIDDGLTWLRRINWFRPFRLVSQPFDSLMSIRNESCWLVARTGATSHLRRQLPWLLCLAYTDCIYPPTGRSAGLERYSNLFKILSHRLCFFHRIY